MPDGMRSRASSINRSSGGGRFDVSGRYFGTRRIDQLYARRQRLIGIAGHVLTHRVDEERGFFNGVAGLQLAALEARLSAYHAKCDSSSTATTSKASRPNNESMGRRILIAVGHEHAARRALSE